MTYAISKQFMFSNTRRLTSGVLFYYNAFYLLKCKLVNWFWILCELSDFTKVQTCILVYDFGEPVIFIKNILNLLTRKPFKK